MISSPISNRHWLQRALKATLELSTVKHEWVRLLQQLLHKALSSVRRSKTRGPLLIAVLTIAVFAIPHWFGERESPLPARGTSLNCKIIAIHDGDTVNVRCPNGRLKVRLYGIDAPELGQQPWGEQSRELLRSLLPATVRLEVMDIDRYGRVVAQLYNGYQDVGLELVRKGGAVVYSQYNNSRAYEVAQLQAKRDMLGVWSRHGAQQEPWEWRKLNPNY